MLDQDIYREYQPPMLYKVMAIKQSIDDISLQYWDHLVEILEVQSSQGQGQNKEKNNNQNTNTQSKSYTQLLFAKGKQGQLVIWRFQNGCLTIQKSIKIAYALVKQISMIKAFSLKQVDAQKNHINLLLLGYQDGVVQIFQIKLDQSSFSLSKCLSMKNTTQQPVRNAEIYNQTDLFICRCHLVYMYQNIISQLCAKLITKSSQQLNSSQTLLKLNQLNNSTKLSIFLTMKNLHIYNELQGVYTFSLPQMESNGTIVDSVKALVETEEEQDIIIAAGDDSLKILYAQSNQIQRIVGLKSFVSTIQVKQLKEEKLLQVWLGDMYGQIHYLLKKKKRIVSKGKKELQKETQKHGSHQLVKQMVMFEQQFKKGLKITQNGIKKLLVTDKLLVVIDTQMNLVVYDIIRNQTTITGRTTNKSQ